MYTQELRCELLQEDPPKVRCIMCGCWLLKREAKLAVSAVVISTFYWFVLQLPVVAVT